MQKTVSLSLGLCALIMTSLLPSGAAAFGYDVKHVLYENGHEQLLRAKENQSLIAAEYVYGEIAGQVINTRNIRSSLGDTRMIYEKDRLIGTLIDYDTIMRSLLFVQTRDESLIAKDSNKNFEKLLLRFSQGDKNTLLNMKGGKLQNLNELIGASLKGKIPDLLANPEPGKSEERLTASNSKLSGYGVGGKFFIHAYNDGEKNLVPENINKLVSAYRQTFAKETALRNYILAVYARTYLAERAAGNGIGRHLYGNEEIMDTANNPWRKELNIFAGLAKTIKGTAFNSALKDKTNTYGKKTVDITDICKAQDVTALKKCIWQAFSHEGQVGSDAVNSGALKQSFSYTDKDKEEQRIPVTSIRQQISLNTIMWIRASLEVSTLTLLSSALLELEAVNSLVSLDDGNYWINPADNLIWGNNRNCSITKENKEISMEDSDGTCWTQDYLSAKEKEWLAPSFDWGNGKYKHWEYVTTGEYRQN